MSFDDRGEVDNALSEGGEECVVRSDPLRGGVEGSEKIEVCAS